MAAKTPRWGSMSGHVRNMRTQCTPSARTPAISPGVGLPTPTPGSAACAGAAEAQLSASTHVVSRPAAAARSSDVLDGRRNGEQAISGIAPMIGSSVAQLTPQGAYSTSDRSWGPAPTRPRLAAGAVHVWRADLEEAGDELLELLSDDERERVARFARVHDGLLWGRAHGLLRLLLSDYLQLRPREVTFTVAAHGKPQLPDGRLSFNLSHSGGLALYAFSSDAAIGVDVEGTRRAIAEESIARRTFGPAVAERLAALEASDRRREFLRLWARHEAMLKCRGTGIGAPEASPSATEPWIAELDMSRGAVAVVACENVPHELRCWDWRA